MIDNNLTVLGALLGVSFIMIGAGMLYAYSHGDNVEDGCEPAPDFLLAILARFRLAGKVCITTGVILLLLSSVPGGGFPALSSPGSVPVSLCYAALLGLLLVILSWNVLRYRVRGLVETFGRENPVTERIVRVHANFAEYVPTGLALLITIEWAGAPALILHFAGSVFALGRCLHAIGMSRDEGANFGRAAGIQATLLALCFMVVTALYYIFLAS